mmetsp:Transcript_26671/g.74695  ORF Transcript_26671/g.74695 Transcript_26671/m.74695 type:complete len:367 (+) Transcript_26671:1115-2215(+)
MFEVEVVSNFMHHRLHRIVKRSAGRSCSRNLIGSRIAVEVRCLTRRVCKCRPIRRAVDCRTGGHDENEMVVQVLPTGVSLGHLVIDGCSYLLGAGKGGRRNIQHDLRQTTVKVEPSAIIGSRTDDELPKGHIAVLLDESQARSAEEDFAELSSRVPRCHGTSAIRDEDHHGSAGRRNGAKQLAAVRAAAPVGIGVDGVALDVGIVGERQQPGLGVALHARQVEQPLVHRGDGHVEVVDGWKPPRRRRVQVVARERALVRHAVRAVGHGDVVGGQQARLLHLEVVGLGRSGGGRAGGAGTDVVVEEDVVELHVHVATGSNGQRAHQQQQQRNSGAATRSIGHHRHHRFCRQSTAINSTAKDRQMIGR